MCSYNHYIFISLYYYYVTTSPIMSENPDLPLKFFQICQRSLAGRGSILVLCLLVVFVKCCGLNFSCSWPPTPLLVTPCCSSVRGYHSHPSTDHPSPSSSSHSAYHISPRRDQSASLAHSSLLFGDCEFSVPL